MFSLEGKNALITGSSGGIGAAIAKSLHGAGATVGLSGTRISALSDLAAELGSRVHVLPCRLENSDEINSLPQKAEEVLGQVNILINNAGITRDSLLVRMSEDSWRLVLDVNLTAAYKLSKGVLRGMMKSRWGRIVNVSSVVGATGNPGQANYAAAKGGIIAMSKSLAYEVAQRGITVNSVAPGFIATAMTENLTESQKIEIQSKIPVGRIGTGSEVASAVVFLCSDEASYITGSTLHINGGMAMY
ncbi:MAG: 3-oxoacyl-[acyl-carrier-protein] reductase [Aestuariivita sp.]|nr:3-oxoacyl-[acyl-carrier-protein] reductase [Aestuariivita sp.]